MIDVIYFGSLFLALVTIGWCFSLLLNPILHFLDWVEKQMQKARHKKQENQIPWYLDQNK